jgi:AraC family transcriptional regulator
VAPISVSQAECAPKKLPARFCQLGPRRLCWCIAKLEPFIPLSSAVKIFQGRFGRVALLDMDAPLVGHAHHHCHILIKTGGSDSAFIVRGERAPLTDDTAVLVNAWEHHAYEHALPPGDRTLILALYIEPAWLAELQRSLALSGHPRFFTQSCIRITAATRKIAEEFVLELWWDDEVAPARLEDLLFNLIVAVIESYSGWRDLHSLLKSNPTVAMDSRIRQSISLMKSDIAHELDVDALASRAGLSRAHFFNLFQRDTRVTPHVYANVLRFEAAIERLTMSDAPLSDVAHALGFSAPSHFSRFFRQHLGITPSDYRRAVNLFEPPKASPPPVIRVKMLHCSM